MSKQDRTQVTRLKARQPISFADNTPEVLQDLQPEWQEEEPPARDRFFRNLTVAAALVLCAVTLRTGAIPPLDRAADAVLTAATDQSLLDEQLGKLSFVSALFPEAVLVFGEQQGISALMPIAAEGVTHVWSEAEPYVSWMTASDEVMSAAAGEVTGIYHGYGDELIVEVSDNAYTWLYGNLAALAVSLGDQLQPGTPIGSMLTGEDFSLEVRRNGESFDPLTLFAR